MKDNRQLWEFYPDSPTFKKNLIRIAIFTLLFPWSLLVMFVLVLKMDYDKVDALADVYQHRVIYFVTQDHPVVFGSGCIALVLVGCWLLARRL